MAETNNQEGLVTIVSDLIDQKRINLAKAYALYFCDFDIEKVSMN